ncbi:sulfatase-like hydrolase/transferase, partial [Candidatus Poribacteria bacterium]|nr:sulfatase-like hydrolase/transferase [Candidatus Poribacteria bacterium]
MNNPNILLVSLETIRRDHLRCHGYHKDLAPHLDRLARDGVYCTDAIANCGWTLPQNITLHTGLYPLTHDLTLLRDQHPLSSSFTLLAEHLKEHGYRTFAGVNSSNPYSAHARYGFDRGFDEHNPGAIYNQHMEWTEEFTLKRFAENHTEAPCFVYTHVNDTHEPWDAPEPWKTMWGDSYHNQYESDISYTDHYLGRIFTGLKEIGILENTLIVIAGDHGTEFWEHGFIEKKVNLYNEILHIPIIFHCPSLLPSGIALSGLSESAQVTPTIVDIAGLPPIPKAQGKSLLPRIQGKESSGLDYVCSYTRHEHQGEGGPVQFDHYSIHTQQYKFIRLELHSELEDLAHDWKYRIQAIAIRCRISPDSLKPGSVMRELYDLKRDPGEGNNLIPREQYGKIAKDLEDKLD